MPIPFIMPKMDMDQESVTIIEWLKKEGDEVDKGEPVIVVETDKITSEVEAPASGTLAGLLYHENEVTPVTKVVAYILRDGETEADIPTEEKPNDQEDEPLDPAQGSGQKGKIETKLDYDDVVEEVKTRVKTPATPLARKMADDESVDRVSDKRLLL